MDLRISQDGFVDVHDLLNLMRKRYPWLDRKWLEEMVKEDEKGRYEIKGSKVIKSKPETGVSQKKGNSNVRTRISQGSREL